MIWSGDQGIADGAPEQEHEDEQSARHSAHVWIDTNREYLNILYRTEREAAEAVVSEPLVVDEPLVRFQVRVAVRCGRTEASLTDDRRSKRPTTRSGHRSRTTRRARHSAGGTAHSRLLRDGADSAHEAPRRWAGSEQHRR